MIQNAGDYSIEAQATLEYETSDGGRGTYKAPLGLVPAKTTRTINLKPIITSGQPDETGQVIPPGTTFGSVTIEPADRQHSDMLVGGSFTFDPDAGTCGGDILPICDPENPDKPSICDIIPIIIIICEILCNRPSVVISGPDVVPLDQSGQGVKSITLIGTADPPGGSFSWSTNSPNVSLGNISSDDISSTVTVTSVSASNARNDVTITLVYAVNGDGNSDSKQITVVKPTYLSYTQSTDPAGNHVCSYSSYQTQRTYSVYDQFTPAQQITNVRMFVSENFTNLQKTCGNPITIINSDFFVGTFFDSFVFCEPGVCDTGGSCVQTGTQSLFVNGFQVKISDGGILHANNDVTWTCTGVAIIGTN